MTLVSVCYTDPMPDTVAVEANDVAFVLSVKPNFLLTSVLILGLKEHSMTSIS